MVEATHGKEFAGSAEVFRHVAHGKKLHEVWFTSQKLQISPHKFDLPKVILLGIIDLGITRKVQIKIGLEMEQN